MTHDLNETLIFVKVVELGSFIAAANALGLPKTTVSRKVQELEQRLGAQLLHRTTRRLGLTEAGAVYHEHCQRIAHELEEAESAVSQLQGGPRGWLRFTVPYSVGIAWITPLLGDFHELHPEIRIDMVLTGSDKVDLIGDGADLALHLGSLPDSSLSARKLATFRTQIFASPDYIAEHGEPLHPSDLLHHKVLAITNQRHTGRMTWGLCNGTECGDYPVDPLFVANDPSVLIGALACGGGLMLSSDVTMKPLVQSGAVRRVLAGWVGADLELNAVFLGGRMLSPKVRAFVDFLVERLNFDLDFMMAKCPAMLAEQARKKLDEAAARELGQQILEDAVS